MRERQSQSANSECGIAAVGPDCYGCGLCACICPRELISIRLNEDGFYSPKMTNGTQCAHCGLCLSVCPFSDSSPAEPSGRTDPEAWAVWSKNAETRQRSSSGGAARELAEEWIRRGRKVCGVIFNPQENRAEHTIAATLEELDGCTGSKYLQSCTLPGFSRLNGHGRFLAVGAPCQIDGLRRYLRKRHWEERFLLADFFCHGVPSMRLWRKYTRLFKKGKRTFSDVAWRDKSNGWHDSYHIVFTGNDGKRTIVRDRRNSLFFNFFLNDICLGKACYDNCKYKGAASAADIRFGDFWGDAYQNDRKGVSAVLTLTEKGRQALEETASSIERKRHPLPEVLNGQMKQNAVRPRNYGIIRFCLKTAMPLTLIAKWEKWTRILLYFPQEIAYRWNSRLKRSAK